MLYYGIRTTVIPEKISSIDFIIYKDHVIVHDLASSCDS